MSDTEEPVAPDASTQPRGPTNVFDRLDAATRTRLFVRVSTALLGSAFRKRRMWPLAVVVLSDGLPDRVTDRASFASWLRANALDGLARECMKRRTPPGCALVYIDVDREAAAGTGLCVVDLDDETKRLSALTDNDNAPTGSALTGEEER